MYLYKYMCKYFEEPCLMANPYQRAIFDLREILKI